MFSHYLFFLFYSLKKYKDIYLVKLLTICHCEYRLWVEKFCFAEWKLLKVKKENATSKAMILFTSFKEDKEKSLFRTDLVEQNNEVVTVCAHHKAFILHRYEVLQNYCCNPFKIHKKYWLNFAGNQLRVC